MVSLNGLIEYTHAELEQKAHDYLRSRPDVQFRIPVHIEALFERCELIGKIDHISGIAKYTRHLGVVGRHRSGNLVHVFLDKEMTDFGPRAVYHAVLGEELAHILLHQAAFIQVKSIQDFWDIQRSMQWPRMERDARRLSDALLMPFKNLVLYAEKMYPSLVDEHGYDIWVVQKLLRNALAEKFVVPQHDMNRRLRQWPCLVYDRLVASLQTKSERLLSHDAVLRVDAPLKQRTIF
jgi:hypothetical protein